MRRVSPTGAAGEKLQGEPVVLKAGDVQDAVVGILLSYGVEGRAPGDLFRGDALARPHFRSQQPVDLVTENSDGSRCEDEGHQQGQLEADPGVDREPCPVPRLLAG